MVVLYGEWTMVVLYEDQTRDKLGLASHASAVLLVVRVGARCVRAAGWC